MFCILCAPVTLWWLTSSRLLLILVWLWQGRSVGVPLDKTPVGNDGSVKGILEVRSWGNRIYMVYDTSRFEDSTVMPR